MKRICCNVLIFSVLTLLLSTCKPKEVVAPSLTTIKFQLLDDNANKVSGATIYLFNSLTDWQESKLARKPINANDSIGSINGEASINIDPNSDSYLLVIYKEPQRKVTLLNVAYDSVITKLPKNIDITVLIRLQAVDGNLGFFTNDKQLTSPITIKLLNRSTTYRLESRRDSVPKFASEVGQIAVNLPPGTYSFQATNQNGCSWTGTQTLTIGGFNKINLSGCKAGEVAFYAIDADLARFPISVTINEESALPFGGIPSPIASYVCGDPNSANVLRTNISAGKYTYSALSADSKCIWTGRFEVLENQTCPAIVKLKTCN
ncbi:MAG: hypothetical protein ACKVOU_12035 [Cytophagales bacterium]